jgi:large subunit ribosomal protein L9
MGAVAEKLAALSITFAAKAGETGKLYGSITTQDLTNAIKAKSGIEVKKQQVDMQPLRTLGEHKAHIRLTMDLIPEIKIVVYREGEAEPGTQPEATNESGKNRTRSITFRRQPHWGHRNLHHRFHSS